MSKWIKTAEKKPPDNKPVLIYTLSTMAEQPTTIAYRRSHAGERCIASWHMAMFWDSDIVEDLYDHDVIYWRPLPKPPLEEQP